MDVSRLTPAERAARGKAARKRVPRSSHADFQPGDRKDPVEWLEEQATTRIPELVPIRHGRMSASAFTFYRGGTLIMAADLIGTPTTGITAQICGDAHLGNFGMYASPGRRMVFDLNDFDETSIGPWEWDVKRLAASVEIAGRDDDFSREQRRDAVLEAVRSYRMAMRDFAGMTNLEVWYSHVDVDDALPGILEEVSKKRAKVIRKSVAKSRTRDSMHAYRKHTDLVDGVPRIHSRPPLIVPLHELVDDHQREDLEERLGSMVRSYGRTLQSDRQHLLRQFRLIDAARRVVGVGSVGTRAWIALLLGRDTQDPLILQVKEAQTSVLERVTGESYYAHHGERVVGGQRLMQAASDIFLGWDRIEGIDGGERDFYFRQFRDWKGSIEIGSLKPTGLRIYARLCGWTLARAHARSSDRIAIAAYLGKSSTFDEAVADFADAYADQNERDYDAMMTAIETGRLQSEYDL